jgi:methionyl-tRNA formyltransferase
MGTSAFAVPALLSLIEHHQVVAAFTQNPKSQGRGMKIIPSKVQEVALANQIDVYCPTSLRNQEALDLVNSITADLIVVCAYGFIIPKNILAAKKYGCFNIHPSLLPKYRGAAPLQRAIINGDSKTAVCIMQMDEGLDTGAIILQQEILLKEQISLQELHDNCANVGATLLLQAIAQIQVLPRIAQGLEGACYAAKLTKDEAQIDWRLSATQIECKIRGMLAWPGSYFIYQGVQIKVLKASVIKDLAHTLDAKPAPGAIINNHNCLHISCGQDFLDVQVLQRPGAKALNVAEFLKGFTIAGQVE